jgi:hypothetical protein
MNHTYIGDPPPKEGLSILETCRRCGQERRRFFRSGTLYYRHMDGTWHPRRPGPCSRELKRKLLAAQLNQLVQFHAYKTPAPCQIP